jgi:hypothetical protein
VRVEVFPGWKFLHNLQEDLDVLDATFTLNRPGMSGDLLL